MTSVITEKSVKTVKSIYQVIPIIADSNPYFVVQLRISLDTKMQYIRIMNSERL